MSSTNTKYMAAIFFGALICIAGWDLFYFMTDDAFIAFRYISQRQLGHGYTWNAPPWLPVEGYTSFAWIAVLDLIWTVTGLMPPQTANALSLLCSLGSLAIFGYWARTLIQRHHPSGNSLVFFAIAVLGLVTHRVFLTWTSSGLETALFNLLVLGWTWCAFQLPRGSRFHQWALTSLAAGIALTRPDGYLFVLATLAALGLHGWRKQLPLRSLGVTFAPLLAVAAHILWRRSFYGEWLPNTYYAKVVGAMPDLGLGYLLSFILEHALWLWVLIIGGGIFKQRPWKVPRDAGPAAIAMATLFAHLIFYSVIAGGDHFEYRVLSHLVPMIILALLWAVLKASATPRTAGLLFTFTLLISSLVPWVHWSVSQDQDRWAPTMPSYPVASELPAIAEGYGETFDELQQWLFAHGVGMRHQQHKLFFEHQIRWVPKRELAGERFGDESNPTVLTTGAGVTGWAFSTAHIIDYYGLNDYVVARTQPYEQNVRAIAHARRPPPGYVEAFQPNMTVTPTQITDFVPRDSPLTDADVRALEQKFRAALPKDRNQPKVYRPGAE